MTKIAGVDYSLTSPAICVWKSEDDRIFDFDSCDVYYLETASRQRTTTHGILNLHSEIYPEWETEEQRHDLLSDWAMSILQGCEVFIEGYAFATSGKSHVRSVAENTGLLKHKLYKNNLHPHIVTPTEIKKWATGKGNASKTDMYNAFVDQTGVELKDILECEPESNPLSDVVDAFLIHTFIRYLT